MLTNYTALSGYRIPMLYPGHLYWGSSGGVLAPSAMVLARAFEWTGNTNYHEAAVQALHFICGRNPVNRVFVSGYGDYQHSSDFYSQFWTNLLQQPPGYLGGNINVDGSALPVVEHPWKRFINTQDADMTEPGVYWNSAFAWLVGYAVNDATLPELNATSSAGRLQCFLAAPVGAFCALQRHESRSACHLDPRHQPPSHFQWNLHRAAAGGQRAGRLLSPACSVGAARCWAHGLKAWTMRMEVVTRAHDPVSVGSTSSAWSMAS